MIIEVITQIKSTYSSLTKSEQKVGEFILNNIDKIAYMSVTEVAKNCSVGEATVLRFCRRLGYNGFHGFKKEIIGIVQEEKKVETNKVDDEVFDEMSTMLEHTLQVQDLDTINKVAEEIKKANNIFIYGLGLSRLCAKAAEIRLSFLGYRVYAFEDKHIQLLKANLVSEDDVVIGLSVSGSTRETVKNIEIAKKNGATIIGITNYNPSPLADLSDYVLLSASKEFMETGTTLVTLTSQIFIIEQICNSLSKIDSERINTYKEKNFNSYD
ncbi:MurPQ operon repressor [uncultured Clostridium sp.]|nr:MurPQ operon repressor [uncultured Clostridium sp.]